MENKPVYRSGISRALLDDVSPATRGIFDKCVILSHIMDLRVYVPSCYPHSTIYCSLFHVPRELFFFLFIALGMSGSCSVRVCWRRLPAFRVAGVALAALHEGAALVRLAQRGGRRPARLRPARPDLKRPNKTDLVYLEDSPDYCERNLT